MTLPAPELGSMRQDISGLIVDWGVSCRISRRSTTRNAAGQITATSSSVGTELMWIQPFEGQSYGEVPRQPAGILDKMTHQAYERFSGTAVQADDQIIATGDNYEYDVVAVQVLHTHRHLFLKQVKRT